MTAYTFTAKATDPTTGLAGSKSASFTVESSDPPSVLLGMNVGNGTGHTHLNGNLVAWQDAIAKVGAGSQPFARCTKLFDTSAGYPSFPATWAGSTGQLFASNNGDVPLVPMFVFNNVPAPSTIASFLRTLPPGQRVAFQYQSEQEGSGLTGATFVANWVSVSTALNTALASMGDGSFFNRQNFPFMTSSLMSYYAGGGDTAFLPPPAHTDIYGSDFYQHCGPGTKLNVGARSDARFQNWLKQVQKVAGPKPTIGFGEYGIGMSTYLPATEAQRTSLLQQDFAYVTDPGSPFTFAWWLYWYQMDKSPNYYCFPLANGSETVAQAQAMISQWQQMVAALA